MYYKLMKTKICLHSQSKDFASVNSQRYMEAFHVYSVSLIILHNVLHTGEDQGVKML